MTDERTGKARCCLRNSPRLIAIDMDGTLLHSDGHISLRNLDALRQAEHAGIEIVVATGRRHSFAMSGLRAAELAAQNALISSNGTVIRTIAADLIHRQPMAVETARWLCTHVNDFRSTLVVTFDKVGPDGEDSHGALVCENMDELHASIGKWMRSNERYIALVPRLEDVLHQATEPPIQMMLCGTIARMAEAEARLKEHPRITGVGETAKLGAEITLHRTIYPERDLSIVDILPAGCSKASALRHLAALRGIRMEEVIAVGDNWNDVPMLEAAGTAVVLGNAPEEILALARQRGWAIGPTNDEDGVAIILEAAASEAGPVVVS